VGILHHLHKESVVYWEHQTSLGIGPDHPQEGELDQVSLAMAMAQADELGIVSFPGRWH
jgi:hypothetical protein